MATVSYAHLPSQDNIEQPGADASMWSTLADYAPKVVGVVVNPIVSDGARALVRIVGDTTRDARVRKGDAAMNRALDLLEAHLDKLSDKEWRSVRESWIHMQVARDALPQKQVGVVRRIYRFFTDSQAREYQLSAEAVYVKSKELSDFHRANNLWKTDTEGRRVPLAAGGGLRLATGHTMSTADRSGSNPTQDRVVATIQLDSSSQNPLDIRIVSREFVETSQHGIVLEFLPAQRSTSNPEPLSSQTMTGSDSDSASNLDEVSTGRLSTSEALASSSTEAPSVAETSAPAASVFLTDDASGTSHRRFRMVRKMF
ncbi:hypothetical protein FA95DRAFT_1568140 [Auriscalpium vulgare]|uniref:Uncharacterized protein n=1 Tax=Auriscalpium vulgare TaxID=40419 RepID=A0ACB8R0A8_9AGAM|nr:hypothetical protein FA95DRAFT_1568140 [Auriscalpium vulgare]